MAHTITGTFSKLLGTVGTVADAATKIVDNTASGLDMLDMYVSTAKKKQRARTEYDMETFYEDLHNEVSLEGAIKAKALETELNNDPDLKKHFEAQSTKLNAIFERLKTENNPE